MAVVSYNVLALKESKMTKCIRDGKVAILFSPGYGAGWSSWNSDRNIPKEFLFHDEKLVEMVENNERHKIPAYAKSLYPEGWYGGADDLFIEWVEPGTQFRIAEYDGSERIEFNYDDYWNVA